MKKILLSALFATFLCGSISAQGVEFFGGTLDEAIAKARAENKKVFIDFNTEWCGPCKAVAKNVFPTRAAGLFFNTNFVCMNIDAEKGEGPAYADLYKVEGYPTFVILDGEGKEVGRWSGASMNSTPEQFIGIVKQHMPEEAAPQVSNAGIDMQTIPLADAVKQAAAQGKYVLLDCYTQWCGPCKMMDREVFPLKEVGDFVNPRFVFVKRDMEADEGPELGKRFRVTSYPTYVILDGQGNEVHRFTGGRSTDAFIAELRSVTDKSMSLKALAARYRAGERDKSFMRDYIAVLSSKRDPSTGGVVAELFGGLNEKERSAPEYWFLYKNFAWSNDDIQRYAVANKTNFYPTVGREAVDDLLAGLCASGYSGLFFPTPNADKALFEAADRKATAYGVREMPLVALYRAAAKLILDNNTDGFLNTVEKYRSRTDRDSLESFVKLACTTFRGSFSAEQKARFKAIVNDEASQVLIDRMLR